MHSRGVLKRLNEKLILKSTLKIDFCSVMKFRSNYFNFQLLIICDVVLGMLHSPLGHIIISISSHMELSHLVGKPTM